MQVVYFCAGNPSTTGFTVSKCEGLAVKLICTFFRHHEPGRMITLGILHRRQKANLRGPSFKFGEHIAICFVHDVGKHVLWVARACAASRLEFEKIFNAGLRSSLGSFSRLSFR